MTDIYGPFDGSPWAEAQWYPIAHVWAPSGVIGLPTPVPTSGPLPFASSGLTVSAGTGKAWVHGAGFERSGTAPTHTVTANGHASFSRRDRLVLRRDLANRRVETAVLTGTAAATPLPPALTQVDGGIWEVPLYSFLTPPNNGTTISGVLDERVWLSDTPIQGKMWKTSGTQGLTTSLAKVGMDASRVSGGVTFSTVTDELTLPCDGHWETIQNGDVTGGSGYEGYFACRRTRFGVADVHWAGPRYSKPDSTDRTTNATHVMPLKAGDKLSLITIASTTAGTAYGAGEFETCSLTVRYLGPLNGADPV